MRFSLQDIPAGEAGTDATVRRMVELVKLSGRRPDLRLLALALLRNAKISGRDSYRAARAIFDFVKRRVRFVNDPVGLETVQQPEITLRLAAGDCDDQAALVAALAQSIGLPARFAVIGVDPDSFRHVFTELLVNGSWLPVDTTSPREFGAPMPNLGAKKVYPLSRTGGLSMPETVNIALRRDTTAAAVRNQVWRFLSQGWETGQINADDLREYQRAIKSGLVEFSGNTFFEPVIMETVTDFLNYVTANGIPSRKSFSTGLQGLSGFFGDLWNGVKSIVKPAAVVGATIVGGPAAGAAAAGALYAGGGGGSQPAATAPGYAGGTVSIPAGGGSVTYNPNLPYQPPAYVQPSGSGDFLSNPIFLLGAAALLIFLVTRK